MLAFLQGNKTYVLAGFAALGTWLAYFLGVPDPQCVPSASAACDAVTLQGALSVTMGALIAATLRAGSKTDNNAAVTAVVTAQQDPKVAEKVVAGEVKPLELAKGNTSTMAPIPLMAATGTKPDAAPAKKPRSRARKASGIALAFFLASGSLAGLTACSSVPGVSHEATTPRLQVLDLQTKYEPLQVLIEAAVTNPETPKDVKGVLKTIDATAVAALDSYTEAAIRNDPQLKSYFDAAFTAITNAVAALARNGFLKEGQVNA